MGVDWRPNLALTIQLVCDLDDKLALSIDTESDAKQHNLLVCTRAYLMLSYVLSLRGPEGFLLDLRSLRKHGIVAGRNHLVIALRGKLKGENEYKVHLLPCAKATDSGIDVMEILRSLLDLKATQGLLQGPAISDEEGILLDYSSVNGVFIHHLSELYESSPEKFPPRVINLAVLQDRYSIFRTMRRTATTRALEVQVDKVDIDVVNRWKTEENSKGGKPNLTMKHYYSQLDLLLGPFLRYSQAM